MCLRALWDSGMTAPPTDLALLTGPNTGLTSRDAAVPAPLTTRNIPDSAPASPRGIAATQTWHNNELSTRDRLPTPPFSDLVWLCFCRHGPVDGKTKLILARSGGVNPAPRQCSVGRAFTSCIITGLPGPCAGQLGLMCPVIVDTLLN